MIWFFKNNNEESQRLKVILALFFLGLISILLFYWLNSLSIQQKVLPENTIIPSNLSNYNYSLFSPVSNTSLQLNISYSKNNSSDVNLTLTNLARDGFDSVLLAIFPKNQSYSGIVFSTTPVGLNFIISKSPLIFAMPRYIQAGKSSTLLINNGNYGQSGFGQFVVIPALNYSFNNQTNGSGSLLEDFQNISLNSLDSNSSALLTEFSSKAFINQQDVSSYLSPLSNSLYNINTLDLSAKEQAFSAMSFLLLDNSTNSSYSKNAQLALFYSSLINQSEMFAPNLAIDNSLDYLVSLLNSAVFSSGQSRLQRLLNAQNSLYFAVNESNPSITLIPINYDQTLISLFPKTDSLITLNVSETNPIETYVFNLTPPIPIGYPLARFTGDAANYLSINFNYTGAITNAIITADLSSIPIDNGQIPFDSINGTLIVSYASIPGLQKSINISVSVNPHQNLFSLSTDCGLDSSFDNSLTDGEALSLLNYQYACNPTCQLGQFNPLIQTQTSSNSVIQDVISGAQKYVGVLNYAWGGVSLTKAVDCSGFTSQIYLIYAQKILPRTSAQQFLVGTPVSENNLQAGDLVFFAHTDPIHTDNSGITHVGIYLGSGIYGNCTFINAPGSGQKVSYGNLCDSYSTSHYAGARRIILSTHSISSISTNTNQPSSSTSTSLSTTSTTPMQANSLNNAFDQNGCIQNFGPIVNSLSPISSYSSQPIPSPSLAACRPYLSIINSELSSTGLLSHGVSVQFVISLIDQESSCNQNIPGGLMQIDSCRPGSCSLSENIRRGFYNNLVPAYLAGRKAGFTGETLLRFMGLFYNRGVGTALYALKLIKLNPQISFQTALNNACLYYFPSSKCNHFGYGANYYDAIQKRCVELFNQPCSTSVS